jgi:beta-lactamase regulating signal transducer with metallopeptidase domain
MPVLIQYLLKLSFSLAVVFLFYHLVLRKLTFYNWNRWYLLGYTLLSFLIPFIDITPMLQQQEWTENGFIQWVPVIDPQQAIVTTGVSTATASSISVWTIISAVFISGALFMLVRLIVQLVSFRRIIKKSELISATNMKIYQVNDSIIPFSFGNSIFINRNLHSEEELQDIIRHEFVHVRQRHSIDIIWGELLCLLNWYNPFAWLLKRSIRQNLEFVADNKVLENGIGKKQYQYLLLKVIGNSQFSIANQFNFSSLKKRIAMMNKMKTARVHVIRFLFVLPLLFVLLVAFRNRYMDTDKEPVIRTAVIVVDKDTRQRLSGVKVVNLNTGQHAITDNNGYYSMELPAGKPISVTMQYSLEGYALLETHSFSLEKKDNKESINLLEVVGIWKENAGGDCIGCGSSVRMQTVGANKSLGYDEVKSYAEWLERTFIDTVPPVKTLNKKGYYIDIIGVGGNCTVVVKDKDRKEVTRMLLTDWDKKEDYYEGLYGKIPPPPPPPPVPPMLPVPPVPPVPPVEQDEITKAFLQRNPDIKTIGWVFDKGESDDIIVLAHIIKKDGTVEKYDLRIKEQSAKAEKKYGKLPVPSPTVIAPPVGVGIGSMPVKTIAPVEPVPGTGIGRNLNNLSDDFEITDKKASIRLKDGSNEEYDLTNAEDKRKFERKYGKIIRTSVNGVEGTAPVAIVNGVGSNTIITPMSPLAPMDALVIDHNGYAITGKEDVLVTITKNTTRQQLEEYKKQMKDKGIELTFDKIEYNEKGKLISISGQMKSGDGKSKSNFSVTDFNILILAMITDGERTYFKVNTKDKEVI